MIRRVPDSSPGIDAILDEQFDQTSVEVQRRYPERASDVRSLILNQKASDKFRQDIKARSRAARPSVMLSALQPYHFHVVTIPDEKMFLLCSNPVGRLSNGGTGHLGDESTELWLPISPHIAVVATSALGSNTMNLKMGREFVREYNEYAAKRSSIIASSSRKLLQSIIGAVGASFSLGP
jgi:hypothetical protein